MAEAKILRPEPEPEPEYLVQLTLTKFEAEVLARLTMVSVLWNDDEFGRAAENINLALTEAKVSEAPYRPKGRLTEENRIWEIAR